MKEISAQNTLLKSNCNGLPEGTIDVSVILIDWNVRESFHSVRSLNQQNWPRRRYELIWINYYSETNPILSSYYERADLDAYIQLSLKGMYFKHQCYNAGFLASRGNVIVVCDSDALFAPTFIASIANWYREPANAKSVLFIEELRSANPSFYPFIDPSWKEILAAPGMINWDSNLEIPNPDIS